mgnify:FL=1
MLFLNFSFFANAQETMLAKDGKEYPATSTWGFSCPEYAYSGLMNAQIAKVDKGGLLKIGIDVSDKTFYIGGNVYLTLEDGSFIICTDKIIRDSKDKQIMAYYFLTNSEMAKLKVLSISNIRFRIFGNQTAYSSKTGHFTGLNKKSNFETFGTTEASKTYDTKTAILSLYN